MRSLPSKPSITGAQDYLVKSQLTPAWIERSIRYAIERHRMDLALLEAEERYHSVFDHLVEGIFQTTPDGALFDGQLPPWRGFMATNPQRTDPGR